MHANSRKSISFVLIFALIISIFSCVGSIPVYAETQGTDGIVDLSEITSDVAIWSDEETIYASSAGETLSSALTSEGITLTGTTNSACQIILDGSTTSSLKLTLSGASITINANESILKSSIKLTNNADVELILKGTNKVTSINSTSKKPGGAGIEVTSPQALLVTGAGTLVAKGGYYGAGIGGCNGKEGSNITIAGSANVTASGDYNGAGIGGGYNGSASNITIEGSATVEANDGMNGAAIGGGRNGSANDITIKDNADVTAKTNGIYGAAIGGGSVGSANNIAIEGSANVKATSGEEGAGIGGGYSGTGSGITITDSANVEAKSGNHGAAIGGGINGNGSGITITGSATVKATVGTPRDSYVERGAGIGSGQGGSANNIIIGGSANVTATGGTYGAGIGGGGSGSANGIIIGGLANVTATSGDKNQSYGAGIGSGQGGSVSNITIGGLANVTATGGSKSGAGIGSGQTGSVSNITIEGGFVTAKKVGGNHDIGIGSSTGKCENISIKGGSVYPVNNAIQGNPTGINGERVYRVTVPAIKTGTNDSLRGNLDIIVPLDNGQFYKAKTISSGGVEHGNSFPKEDASAYIYLPVSEINGITVGGFSGAFANVKSSQSQLTDNIVLWQNKVPIYFDGNGATEVSPKSIDVAYGGTYGELPNATKTAFSLDGWYTTSSGGTKISSNSIVNVMNPTTLYAMWSPKKLVVTFDSTNCQVEFPTMTAVCNSTYGSLAVATKAGFNFAGWYDAQPDGNQITEGMDVTKTENHTLYPKWVAKTLNVTYVTTPGVSIQGAASKLVSHAALYGDLNNTAKKEGYSFAGWYTATSGGSLVTSSTSVSATEDHSLYTRMTPNQYDLTFYPNGGSASSPSSKNVTFDTIYGNLPNPTKAGYTFTGWYTSTDAVDLVTSGSIVNTATDHALYAAWTEKNLVVTFSSVGCDVEYPTKSAVYNSTYGSLGVATKAGFNFSGWYDASSEGNLITSGSVVTKTDDHILYPGWEAKTLNVTYVTTAGVSIQGATSKLVSHAALYGDLNNTAKKEGYSFAGWYTGETDGSLVTSNTTVSATQDHNLYTRMTPNQYDVTFNSNGGNDPSPATMKVTFDAIYGDFPTPTKAGYTFTGWYTSTDAVDLVTSGSIVKTVTDHALYAAWSVNKYTVTFDGNGTTDVSKTTMEVVYGDKYGTLPVANREGYTFGGWQTEKSGGDKIESDTDVKIVEDTTLYAIWSADSVTVTFYINGEKKTIIVTKGGTYGSLPTPEKKGHSFLGWFTAQTGGTEITSSTKVSENANHTLYAHWDVNKYKLTFKANAKSVKKLTLKSKNVAYGSKLGKLPKPKKIGYKFKGWYTKKSGGTKMTKNSKMKYDKNIKLYAKWIKNGKMIKDAHLRVEPGESKTIKGSVKKGTKVCILKKVKLETGHVWYKVKVGKETGYIYSLYVKRI